MPSTISMPRSARIVPAIPHRLARAPAARPSPPADVPWMDSPAPRKRPMPAQQLPPPFYPSTPPAVHPHATPKNSIPDDSLLPQTKTCAPAPPAQTHYPPAPSLPPPPGLPPPQYPPFFPGHIHHPSDLGAPWISPPPSSHAFAASEHARFAHRRLSSEHGDDQHSFAYPTATAPTGPHPDETAFDLAAYLSTHVGNPDFADFVLQIRSPDAVLCSVPVHGILVVRSPVIAEAVRYSPVATPRGQDGRRILDVLVSDCFITRESLQEAVKVLYGAPLLSAQNFLFGLAPYRHHGDDHGIPRDARQRMHQILSYIAAASALKIPSMIARGVDIARLLVRWDTVDLVLRYALQGNPATRSPSSASDGEDPFVAALLTSAIDFMACTIPADFQLHTHAPELKDIPRLPAFVESPPAPHNPRLSNICFGDAPPKNSLHPCHTTSVLSSTFVSLPLPLVNRLLNHCATANQLGWTGVVGLMQDVIHERENRRQKALQAQRKSAHPEPLSTALVDNLQTQEFLEQVEPSPIHPSGHRLVAKPSLVED